MLVSQLLPFISELLRENQLGVFDDKNNLPSIKTMAQNAW